MVAVASPMGVALVLLDAAHSGVGENGSASHDSPKEFGPWQRRPEGALRVQAEQAESSVENSARGLARVATCIGRGVPESVAAGVQMHATAPMSEKS